VKYFFMLAGDRTLIKPDRVVLGYLSRVLGRAVDPEEALPLDYAIWSSERRR